MRKQPKLARLGMQILEALWALGKASIREIQERFPEPRPAYTTIQTTVYRLESKGAVRRVRKISNAHIFEPLVARDVARHRLLDDIPRPVGGRAAPALARVGQRGGGRGWPRRGSGRSTSGVSWRRRSRQSSGSRSRKGSRNDRRACQSS